MSFYSSGDVQTLYLDPKSFVDGNRAVFELNGHHLAILPNIRLLDNGVFGQADGLYNALVGADSIITDVVLYDGRTELSRLSKFGSFRGFEAQNQGNVKTKSLRSPKTGSRIGYEQAADDKLMDFIGSSQPVTKAARADSDGSMIDLREILPMLNSVTHLPVDVFQNLRLEITYNTAAANQILADITNTITGMLIPQLAIDVLDDEVLVKKMNRTLKNAQWLEIESDQVLYPISANDGGANDQGVKETKNFKLDGFKNKSVERVLMVKQLSNPAGYLTGNAVNGWGKFGSAAFFNEEVQVRVNGSNLFPKSGIVGDHERLAYVADTWGETFAFPGSNNLDVDSGLVVGSDAADGRLKGGTLSYVGFYVGEKVVDMQIVHSRQGLQDTGAYRPTTSAVNCIYFAEIKKALVINPDGYQIVYL